MDSTDRVKRANRPISRRGLLVALVLAAVAGGGFLLRQSGHLDLLVGSVMDGRSARAPVPADFAIRVTDEHGQPVPAFDLKLLKPDGGGTIWMPGTGGRLVIPGRQFASFVDLQAIDAVVRADGFASARARFAGLDRESLLAGRATITVRPGEQIELRLRPWPGAALSAGLRPDVYFADHRVAARLIWPEENRRAYGGKLPDQDTFNLTEAGEGRFKFRIARGTDPFHVAVHSPGFLRFFEAGPFTSADISAGLLEIDLPEPASLGVTFDRSGTSDSGGTRGSVSLAVMSKDPYRVTPTYLEVASRRGEFSQEHLRLEDLAPGTYKATVVTGGGGSDPAAPGSAGGGSEYRDSEEVTLGPGAAREIAFTPVPLDPNVYRGDRTAKIHFARPDGSPAAGHTAAVVYRDENYGDREVFSGEVGRSGELAVPGLSGKTDYRVEVGERLLGTFRLDTTAAEALIFSMPPQAGDPAPDVELLSLATRAPVNLRDFRGKVVCLELWATGCGPCQEPMAALDRLAAEKREAWGDRVAVVSASVDGDPDDAARHVERNGWSRIEHLWSGAADATDYDAPVMRAFMVPALPETVVIGRDGRIAWRGHPAQSPGGLAARIEEAIGD